MNSHKDKRVQFYDHSHVYNRRILFSFKVNNINDAKHALKRFGVPAGWYVERDEKGNILTNVKINPS